MKDLLLTEEKKDSYWTKDGVFEIREIDDIDDEEKEQEQEDKNQTL
jgi:hypothetical protein